MPRVSMMKTEDVEIGRLALQMTGTIDDRLLS
jgi:hypothetical protein